MLLLLMMIMMIMMMMMMSKFRISSPKPISAVDYCSKRKILRMMMMMRKRRKKSRRKREINLPKQKLIWKRLSIP